MLKLSQRRLCLESGRLWKRSLRTGSACASPSSGPEDAQSLEAKTPKVTIELNSSPFDTNLMIKQLQQMGFSQIQSEGLVAILIKLGSQKADLSSKDLDLLELRIKSNIEAVKHSQVLLKEGSLSQLRDKSDDLRAEIGRLKENLKDEVTKINSGVQLDINLERSRNKENETIINQKIKDTHNRIDTEVALLRTAMESNKVDTLKYTIGGVFTMASVFLAIWRLLK
ncbi:PREDICTED: mitochondrial calcium uniporter regulator 1-like [Amphimedon queenslandica]|uniref:Uncharacterized protein n=1 Tax=Amphimedon queenslandica TaxID=400682 RepID=A0A1X7VEF6_AMPQE|nr:PREDICTED: mitochondrial calcium uniporter regulator 1-like [Amphimedon queenslandica]|eukprot:XP_019849324.1 PREDICTED: mitochondrial calcium uniporter regulator 1-like [Amphimedon queenslandica]